MRKIAFLLPLLLLCLTACKEAPLVKQYKEIKLLQWKQENPLEYELDIPAKENYRLAISLRYTAHIPHKSIKLTLNTTWPSGKTSQKTYEIAIKDDAGGHKGEVMGEIADVVQVIEENSPFAETGKHKFSIKQEMAADLGGVQEVGLLVFKPKK